MQTIQPSKLLKIAFVADAAACGGTAALQLIAPQFLSQQLALPSPLLIGTGLFLALYAVSLLFLATCRSLWKPLVWAIIAGNVGWAAITLDLVVTGMIAPNGLGLAYLAVQSLTVLGLAGLEYAGLKASRAGARVGTTHALP